jgi:hypothetical protein
LAFLDDDDLYMPDRLEMVLEPLQHRRVVICWTRFMGLHPGDNRVHVGDVRHTLLDGLVPNLGGTTLHRDAMLPLDESLRSAEDVEWWVRMSHRYELDTVRRVGHLYRQHDGSRHGNDLHTRLNENIRILAKHRQYFLEHPRAAAFRWKRVGLMAEKIGDRRTARKAFLHSLQLAPEAATTWHLLRSLRWREPIRTKESSTQ